MFLTCHGFAAPLGRNIRDQRRFLVPTSQQVMECFSMGPPGLRSDRGQGPITSSLPSSERQNEIEFVESSEPAGDWGRGNSAIDSPVCAWRTRMDCDAFALSSTRIASRSRFSLKSAQTIFGIGMDFNSLPVSASYQATSPS